MVSIQIFPGESACTNPCTDTQNNAQNFNITHCMHELQCFLTISIHAGIGVSQCSFYSMQAFDRNMYSFSNPIYCGPWAWILPRTINPQGCSYEQSLCTNKRIRVCTISTIFSVHMDVQRSADHCNGNDHTCLLWILRLAMIGAHLTQYKGVKA